MMKSYIPTLILVFVTSLTFAQKKSELIEKINNLDTQLKTTENTLAETQRELSSAKATAENLELRVTQLTETNEGLMKNLNNFITASTERSDNIGRTLEALRAREAQLKVIRDTFSSNDSIAFQVLTDLKKTLGEDAQIGVDNGSVTVMLSNVSTFGSKENSSTLTGGSKSLLGRLAETINRHNTVAVTVESQGGDWDVISKRVAAISNELSTTANVAPERIQAVAKSGMAEVTMIRLHPKFNQFYLWLHENMKNNK